MNPTRYDVDARDETVRVTVLSVREESYTVEEEMNPLLSMDGVNYILKDKAADATHYLLDELIKYVKCSKKEVRYGKYQVSAQIHLPYVKDEVVSEMSTMVTYHLKTISELRLTNLYLCKQLGALESLWFVRLYTWWKEL